MILDIETTGLSPLYTQVILVGIIYYDGSTWKLTQIFCDHRREEKELLKALSNYIEDHLIITYNGHAFDIPYLNKRYQENNLDFSINNHRNFDLYRVIRSSKKALNLSNYKLKTIEEYLGIFREDQISGKESVELYNLYEENPTVDFRHKILLHNSDDIEYMIPTFKILDDIPEEIISKYYPFILKSDLYTELICTDYHEEKDYLSIEWQTRDPLINLVDYSNGFSLEIQGHNISIKLPLFHIENRRFIDVDQLIFLDTHFNDLSYDQQVTYELSNKKSNIIIAQKILEKHHL